MPLMPFKELLAESGDLKLLHTTANIPAPEITKSDNGDHIAIHKPSTAEHADWLKGKFEKALKHNPSSKHIKIAVRHDGDEHEVKLTHHHPKNVKEEVILESEKKFNKGDHVHFIQGERAGIYSAHGVVHHSNDRTAEVHWENGTKNKYLHSTGKEFGNTSPYAGRISHNDVYDGETGKTNRLKNDEHKEHLKKIADSQEDKRAHEAEHRSACNKLSCMHPSELKPHHLKAIHDIIDRAKAGHD
jgi:hypothetical protein